jgi:hypothetical protein|tara:strand:+ start:80 stop:430 length:351 start_codon:yes stop_codon:yes gene_type:complete
MAASKSGPRPSGEEARKNRKEIIESIAPIMEKKGAKGEVARTQLEKALKTTPQFTSKPRVVKKIAEAAGDDKQLERTLRKISRDLMRSGGRAGYKSGSKGCKLAMKGKGRAYGKNS